MTSMAALGRGRCPPGHSADVDHGGNLEGTLLDHIAQVVLATETPWSDLGGVKDTRFGLVADLHVVDAAFDECVEDTANHAVVKVPLVAMPPSRMVQSGP